ncbi:MAG: SDR family oxidoreductase [Martelella sp.]|uniref:Gluconate 5-dehydrogenase n=1 Tax=Martelella mediterranea DSM 17316 TaxID=1122214 RepID=A0A1U9Z049_9HYPH|nr:MULTISPECIES: SDR family oxidoreductase [Martelella]AQZ51076.1 Gluconate 5-dehydrogenase [Martelella mediterranea DSM 17316]MAU22107.1 SDR family oxidoreductase [Martelella sp.]|tara:strand:- start:586 stop:1350 length:765 start_codon:yes stop_codon:yes gene_type:complete
MSDMFRLDGKIALVTGSSQGIGNALAQGLADQGAIPVINGRDAARTEAAVEAFRKQGIKAWPAIFDVTDRASVEAGIAKIEDEIGPIEILINNAGIQYRTPLEDFPAEQWQRLFDTNVSGTFYTGQAVARHMIGRGRGKIINICSVQSELARPGIAPYTATKGAVRNLTRGMCTDWAKYGLQINAIAPGYFETPLNQALVDDPAFTAWLEKRTPAGRWGNVEELIGAAVFLASSASSFVNGHTLAVDGGITVSV